MTTAVKCSMLSSHPLAFSIHCLPLHIHQPARIAAVERKEPVKVRTCYPVAAQRTVRPVFFVTLHYPLPHALHLRECHIIVHAACTSFSYACHCCTRFAARAILACEALSLK